MELDNIIVHCIGTVCSRGRAKVLAQSGAIFGTRRVGEGQRSSRSLFRLKFYFSSVEYFPCVERYSYLSADKMLHYIWWSC